MSLKHLIIGAGALLVAGAIGAAKPQSQSPIAGAPIAGAQVMGGSAPAPSPAPPAKPAGYLTAARTPDATALLGPPPGAGSGTGQGDLATYLATRRLEGSGRWALAARDAEFGPAPMLRDFSCAVGVDLDPASAPALMRLFGRVVIDTGVIQSRAKSAYRRPRPFVAHGGSICVKPEPWLVKSYSYPSGHSTYGWTTGLILAQIAPDRAGEIMARARVYGDSRVVCGVHNQSDVQAGRMAGAALMTALEDDATFQADLEQARLELARIRTAAVKSPDAAECRAEAQAVADPVW
jgi:acid phosphatase (class A)